MEVPLDGGGFAVSFDSADAAGIAGFLRAHGFVVVREVLSQSACAAAVDDAWAFLESEGWRQPADGPRVGGVSRADPASWEASRGWPGGISQTEGIIGEAVTWTRTSLTNRMSPKLPEIFGPLMVLAPPQTPHAFALPYALRSDTSCTAPRCGTVHSSS